MSLRTPKYRLHKASGQALVQIDGKRTYLGKHGTEKSKERYRQLVAEWLASGVAGPATALDTRASTAVTSVNELILAFWKHAERRYVKNGKPTSEIRSFRTALRPLHDLYGLQPVTSFGPLALVSCRQVLIDQGICRKRINQHVTRIRQVFRWGVSRELVPETIWLRLRSVEGLRRGEAVETEPVKPVPEEHVSAVEPFVTPQIWAMVNLQLWTGCRPGEARHIRTIDLNMETNVWEYRPFSHKTEHHGKERIIYLGPHAQETLTPWLKTDVKAFLFSPQEAMRWFHNQRAMKAKRRPTPNRENGQRRESRRKQPGDCYSTHAYDHAISRACKRAGVPPWAPNRLRHNAATRIRSAYGIEAARIILGHSSAVTSEIYAEIDKQKAIEIISDIG